MNELKWKRKLISETFIKGLDADGLARIARDQGQPIEKRKAAYSLIYPKYRLEIGLKLPKL